MQLSYGTRTFVHVSLQLLALQRIWCQSHIWDEEIWKKSLGLSCSCDKNSSFLFWLCWVFLVVHGLLFVVAPLVEHAPLAHGLSSCSCMSLVASGHVGSQFPGQGPYHIRCIRRWILNHWTTGKVPVKNSQGLYLHVFLLCFGYTTCSL